MSITTVGVIGAGAMGSGIAQLFAQNGYTVLIQDIQQDFIDRGLGFIEKNLTKLVSKEKISPEGKDEITARLTGTLDLQDFQKADFVVEAAIEDISIKQDIFKQLDSITAPETILASNTSSLSITEIAAVTSRPDKVAGMHFFNPAPVMKLVEVIKGLKTSDETAEAVKALAEALKKVPVLVKKDEAGFIVNRLMIPQLMEAIKLYDEGIASKEDIDKAIKFGLNHPMGPFELMDLTGIDIAYFVNNVFQSDLPREMKHTTPYSLRTMIRAGRLGRKTKAGWYDY
ncbi:MAG: 3-hydroxybutyryl-CoA dehydrogenase [Desulfohalobiaceae bacterium]|nr:3-hydroxybutyryl-CoA dehydrogenase [Desulfohalobiaceae bacterium]